MASLASTRSLTVPFLDLTPVNAAVKDDVLAAVSGLIDKNEFGSGAAVQAFEDEFAEYCESAHAVGVASGLDALRLGLLALGIEPGDEVIVPAMTFVATFEAVVQAGGTPVVVDVREDDVYLDVAAAAAVAGASPVPPAGAPVRADGRPGALAALAGARELLCSRMRARRTARAETASSQAPAARRLRSASIRRRTWARWAMPAHS